MLSSVLRSLGAILGVVAAILVAQRYGESNVAKLLTVAITSTAVVMFDALMTWTPKRFPFVRRKLDKRAIFTGTWLQDVKRAHGTSGPREEWANSFAVFSVSYSREADNYRVEGTAYTTEGVEHARWQSTDIVHFAKDGRSMTYEWKGSVTNANVRDTSLDRTGFARLSLSGDDGGQARVDHVGQDISLEINILRITKEWLTRNHLEHVAPKTLEIPATRDEFAKAWARQRA